MHARTFVAVNTRWALRQLAACLAAERWGVCDQNCLFWQRLGHLAKRHTLPRRLPRSLLTPLPKLDTASQACASPFQGPSHKHACLCLHSTLCSVDHGTSHHPNGHFVIGAATHKEFSGLGFLGRVASQAALSCCTGMRSLCLQRPRR